MADLTEYVNVKTLCKAHSMSRSGIYDLCKKGNFPQGIRLGRSHRWAVHEVNEWLNARKGA